MSSLGGKATLENKPKKAPEPNKHTKTKPKKPQTKQI